MQYYKFTDNTTLITEFKTSNSSNSNIHKALKDKTFKLEPLSVNKHTFLALDSNGNRIYTETDYDFSGIEIEKFLVKIYMPETEIQHVKFIDWVNQHNLGELSFDKVVKMYKIATGE